MKAHQYAAVLHVRGQLTAVKCPVLRTVKLHVEVFARRFAVFIELSRSKINGAYACYNTALSNTFGTEVVSDLKHHSRLDRLFELIQVLYRGDFGLIGCDLCLFRLHGCRLLLFRLISADILIKSAVEQFIIGDIFGDLKRSA